MVTEIVIAFEVTPEQVSMIKEFCSDKLEAKFTVSVRQILNKNMTLSLTMLRTVETEPPRIYFAIMSNHPLHIISGENITDEALKRALYQLDLKYALNSTRKEPHVDPQLGRLWADYLNEHHTDGNIIKISL